MLPKGLNWTRFRNPASLGWRLGLTMVLSLAPLGFLSYAQLEAKFRQVDAATLAAIDALSRDAVRGQIDLIQHAQTLSEAMATQIALSAPDDALCNQLIEGASRSIPQAALVAYVPLTGVMRCASAGRTGVFTDDPLFRQLTEKPEPTTAFNPKGPVTGVAIIATSHPVLEPESQSQRGIVVVSLPYSLVSMPSYQSDKGPWKASSIIAFTADGELLGPASQTEDLNGFLPKGRDWSTLADTVRRPEFFVDEAGNRKIVSVSPLGHGLSVMAIWNREPQPFLSTVAPYLTPVLTWLAALGVAIMASERLVVRHIRALADTMRAYRKTRRHEPPQEIAAAPQEIRDLNDTYLDMVLTISKEEAELQTLLEEKGALVKEVHHRSGNSLQIISSVIRMYRRETDDPTMRMVLDGLVNRVLALSSTHTSLYSLAGQRNVPAHKILADVVGRLKSLHGMSALKAEKDLRPMELPSEAAIPLSLALSEILSVHFAQNRTRPSDLRIALERIDGGECRLAVAGPALETFSAGPAKGLGVLPKRMLSHYATQLGGRVEVSEPGPRQTISVVFPDPSPLA